MQLIYPPLHVPVEVPLTATPTSITDLVDALIVTGTLDRGRWPNSWSANVLGALVSGTDCTAKYAIMGNGEIDCSTEVQLPGNSAKDHTLEGSGTATVRLLLDSRDDQIPVGAAI